MKGGVAVMLELARDPELARRARFVFFTREEVALGESPLPQLFASGLLDDAELAVVMEPTDNELHAGCLGNVVARVTFRGVSAHSARPWTGLNAIHEAVRGLQAIASLEPHDVEVEGLVFREVVSSVRISGGIAENVVPAEATAELNFRFAPGRSIAEAEARLRELVRAGELEVMHAAPAAPVALSHPLVVRLRGLVTDVRPKQAWTPVAQFAEAGIAAINYGPGATAYAHKRDEQIAVASLERSYETLASFLRDSV
jgi:succinyl-diaminopimelate desuccinylase